MGICTQNPELRKRFKGKPEYIINYLTFVAEELRDSSVVLATYDAGENMRGLIGVVGPTRMDYSKVAAKLSFIAAGLSKLLGGGTLPPPGLDNKLIIKGDDTDEHENERPEADGAGNGSGR